MKRIEYVYVAVRIDPRHPQSLGDHAVIRRGRGLQHYHYDSARNRLVNRGSLQVIRTGSAIWRGCVNAVERLHAEEEKR